MITDAQFSARLNTDAEWVVLYEQKFAVEVGGAPVEGTVYISDAPYATGPADSPPNQPYASILRKIPRVETTIEEAESGLAKVSQSDATLDNTGGAAQFMLRLILDGRDGTFYLGAPQGTPGWTRSDFRQVGVMAAEYATGTSSEVTVKMRDKLLRLDKAIAGDVVNDNRRKPLVFCWDAQARSIEPVQKGDGSTLEYYALQNYVGGAVTDARDNGASLVTNLGSSFGTNAAITANAGTDTITVPAGHPWVLNDVCYLQCADFFAGFVPGAQYWVVNVVGNDVQLSATKAGAPVNITGTVFAGVAIMTKQGIFTDKVGVDGTIQLSRSPVGRLTVDVTGYSPSQNSAAGGPGELIRAMMVDYVGVATTEIDAATFQTAGSPSLINTIFSTARAVIDRENFLNVTKDIAEALQIKVATDHQGLFHAFCLDMANLQSAAPAYEIGSASGLQPLEAITVANRRVIVSQLTLNTGRNYQPLSYGELALAVKADVDLSRRLTSDYRQASEFILAGTSYAANWPLYFRLGNRVVRGGSFEQQNLDIPTRITALMANERPHLKTIDVAVELSAYSWRLGSIVRITDPLWDLQSGWNTYLVSKAVDLDRRRCNLRLLTQMDPDYLSLTH
jgi:hypothetical protein